jgi:hypothetical protein
MSDVQSDPRPQDGWLDTWLSEVARTDNMRLRGNAAIALATLGGPARIEEFIELVGDTAIKMKEGRSGAAEAIAVALREVERPDFDREALARAFEKSRNDDRPERQAARALLMPAHPVIAWWRLRGVAPWAGLWRTLAIASPLAACALLILLVAMWLLIDRRGGFNILGGDNGMPLLLLLFGACVGSVGLARIAVAGQRTRVGLILDGLVCGLTGASPLLITAFAASTDKSQDPAAHNTSLLWVVYIAAALAVASVRVFVGVSPTGRRRLPAVMSAIAWPVATVTFAALAATWFLGNWPGKDMDTVQAVISWAWVGFVVTAPAFAAAVGAADDLRRTSVTPFAVFRPPNPAVLLGVSFIVLVPILSAGRKPVHEFNLTADQISGPFVITNDQRFALTFNGSPKPGKDGLEVAFDGASAGFVLDAGGDGDYLAAAGETDVKPPYERVEPPRATEAASPDAAQPAETPIIDDGRYNSMLAQASMTRLGRHFRLQGEQVEDLCMVQRGNRRCGVPSAQVGWWLQILSGRTERLGEHKDLHFYVYRPTPARAASVTVPNAWYDRWDSDPTARWTAVFTPPERRPALQIQVARPLYLRVRPDTTDTILDRVVVVQQVDKPDDYTVWSADDPDPPQVSLQLQPNHTYLVCVRMVHAMFLDCTHQTRGILAEPITLTLTQDRPAETAPDRVAPPAPGAVALTSVAPTPGSRP